MGQGQGIANGFGELLVVQPLRIQPQTSHVIIVLKHIHRVKRNIDNPIDVVVSLLHTSLEHAYDLCEGGVQFELDAALKLGTPVALKVTLPGGPEEEGGREVSVLGPTPA